VTALPLLLLAQITELGNAFFTGKNTFLDRQSTQYSVGEFNGMASSNLVRVHRLQEGSWEQTEAEIIAEIPVSLTVNGEVWLTFMCTPVHMEALAVGFLYNEGILEEMDEVASVRVCEHGDNVDVWLTHPADKPEKWRRTSGCTGGLTAVEAYLDLRPATHTNGAVITPEQVSRHVEMLLEAQELYRKVGGVHTSALSDGEKVIVSAEDIGRHNTLDKIAGLCLMQDIHPKRRILVTTGRISSEMLQKAARIGASIVISRTAPSSLSVQMAQQLGVTLIGYARRDRFNVYAHAERIVTSNQLPVISHATRNS